MNSDRNAAPIDGAGASARPSRRFRDERGEATPRRLQRRIGATLILLAPVLIAFLAYLGFRVPEARDPIRPRTVEPFALKDTRGRMHRLTDWRDAAAVVLFVIGTRDPASEETARALRRLSERWQSQGIVFLGVSPDPAAAAGRSEADDLPFPVLLDPAQELIGDLGVRATPEAVVLDAQGHVLYRGRIDGVPADANGRGTSGHPVLEKAIRAALTGAEPPASSAEPPSSPLPPPRPLVGAETLTYHRDVAPILWNHCASCHRPGEVGPFSLLTYKDAAKRAGFLGEVTASRRMPPFRPVHGYGDFHDAGRLSRRELAVLAHWAEAGAPEGDPADATSPPAFPEGWQLGTPDLVVTMPETFTLPGDVPDRFRGFVLPLPLERDTAIAAIEFRPGNRRIVHHARFFADSSGDSRRRDAADPAPGFNSSGSDIPQPGMGAWVPGLVPRLPPSDVGRVIRKGTDFVAMIHYHGTGKTETDRSTVGVYFCKTPPKRAITTIPLNSAQIDIPAGVKRHRIAVTRHLIADAHAIAVMPHGHLLMREISLTATLPEGRVVPLLWIDDWDFNWQGQYHFARPVGLPKGTRLDLVAFYDNSADNPANPNHPPQRVQFGWSSTDEMLGCYLQVLPDDDESRRAFDKALPLGL